MEGIFNASSMPYNALYDLMNNCNHLFIVTPLESIRYWNTLQTTNFRCLMQRFYYLECIKCIITYT